jgi:hypothetical protein
LRRKFVNKKTVYLNPRKCPKVETHTCIADSTLRFLKLERDLHAAIVRHPSAGQRSVP